MFPHSNLSGRGRGNAKIGFGTARKLPEHRYSSCISLIMSIPARVGMNGIPALTITLRPSSVITSSLPASMAAYPFSAVNRADFPEANTPSLSPNPAVSANFVFTAPGFGVVIVTLVPASSEARA